MKNLPLSLFIIGLLLLTPICLNAAGGAGDAATEEAEQSDGAEDVGIFYWQPIFNFFLPNLEAAGLFLSRWINRYNIVANRSGFR